MARRRRLGWLGALAWAVTTTAGLAAAGPNAPSRQADDDDATLAPPRIDLDALPAEAREKVRALVEQPTVAARGPVELFHCQPEMYRWLMDHPDQTVRLWRKLGAKVMDVTDQGGGRFGWADDKGSEVHWDCVLDEPHRRIWYAEGKVKPGLLLPAAAVRAVVVLEYTPGRDRKGNAAIRHQASIVLHTDSRAMALGARLMGASAPKMAEQFLGQLEAFFAAMAWHIDQHPDEAAKTFAELKIADAPLGP